MINFNFSSALTEAKWGHSNNLVVLNDYMKETNLRFIPQRTKEIPLILIPQLQKSIQEKNNEVFSLKYLTNTQFRGRKLTGAKILDVIEDMAYAFVDVNSPYIFGKGYIGIQHPTYVEHLLIVTAAVENGEVIKSPFHCKVYISPKLTKNKFLNSIVFKGLLGDYEGDIITSSTMVKYFGILPKLPKFVTVGEQVGFIKQMFAQILTQAA